MADKGTRHLSADPSMYQPVRTNNFEFVVNFQKINDANAHLKLIRPGTGKAIPTDNAQDVITFSVISFTPPHFSQDEIEIRRGNSKIYFAGTPTFDSKDLKINDYMGADGKSILMAWQACSYDVNTDTIPSSDKYKTNATVFEYLPDGTLVRSWVLYGCWVKSLSEDSWDNESTNKKTVSAQIRYDYAIPTTGDSN